MGYAPQYVDAMFRMAIAESPDDYVVATGRLSSVRDLCEAAFKHLGLNHLDFVRTQPSASRAVESFNLQGDPAKIKAQLAWVARKTIEEIMIEMVEHELARLKGSV